MKVLVLMGGDSAEREISLSTAKGVMDALRRLGYEVMGLDPASGGPLPGGTKPLEHRSKSLLPIREMVKSPALAQAEVVFLALHGGKGEDGTIQSLLDLAGIPYTGSGLLASALAMHKPTAKLLFQGAGISTPAWFVIKEGKEKIAEKIRDGFGFPVVVKPASQGSTVGTSIIKEEGGLEEALNFAQRFDQETLIEKYIAGRELTVGILDKEPLPVVEVIPQEGFYDYQHKYTKGKSRYVVPAHIPPQVTKRIKELALQAFELLRCEGYARGDFRYGDDGELYCLEVNTLPGMTPTSLVPMAAQAAGIGFDQLVERIIKLALKKGGQVGPN